MNIFVIPSWYPSISDPIYGIFNKEQVEILAKERPLWRIGVSIWGQGDERFLLRAMDWKSVPKLFKRYAKEERNVKPNLIEYFTPSFIWTRKLLNGNIEGIIKSNELNFDLFTKRVGMPDVIVVMSAYPGSIIAQRLSEKHHVPYVIHSHMSPYPFEEFLTKKRTIKPWLKKPLDEAGLLIAESHAQKDQMETYSLKNIEVLLNCVDTSFFIPKKHVAEKCTILLVGRMEEQKGIDLLLQAIKHIKTNIDFEVRMGGDGSKRSAYQALSKELGAEDKITWLGRLTRLQVLEEMQACAFYVLPSRHESFGIVLIEAMACGKPVVATRCGGPKDIINDTVGYLCEIDPADLAEKMSLMIENYTQFDSGQIRETVEERFSHRVWTEKLERIYRNVV